MASRLLWNKWCFCVCVFFGAIIIWLLSTRFISKLIFRTDKPPLSEGSKCISARKFPSSPLNWTINDNESSIKFPPWCQNYFPCDWTPQSFFQPTRIQTSLHCGPAVTTISFREVASFLSPALTAITDPFCLKRIVNRHCRRDSGQRIPNVVHYVRFGAFNLTLDAFLSAVSVARFLQPCLVLIHGDAIPTGPYWRALLHLVPNMVHVPRQRPRQIFGRPVNVVEHSADISRIQLLREYGGVCMDKDYLMLRSLDDLFNLSVVMGTESNTKLCCAFIIAEPGAKFLDLWISNYTDFQDRQWAEHSGHRPYLLSKDYPRLIRVTKTFFHPPWPHIKKYYSRESTPAGYDWSENHGLHLYSRVAKEKVYGPYRLDRQDSVIADIVRYILFGKRAVVCEKLGP